MQAVILVVGLALLGIVCALLFQILKQQGRILVRLEELEERRRFVADPVFHHDRAEPEGLPVGAELPHFRLPDLRGEWLGSEDLKGTRALLTHWSPSCGFCEMIAPDLAEVRPDLEAGGVRLVLVSHGEPDENERLVQEHGLRAPVVLQGQSGTAEFFAGLGTPVAYLIDEHGRVAAPLAVGAEEVPRLAREVASGSSVAPSSNGDGSVTDGAREGALPGQRDLRTSRLLRDGLAPGTRAPDFSLPDVRGGTVTLESFRGRPVLLVFTDPDCGPCEEVLPRLGELQRVDDGLAVVLVGRGAAEDNLSKLERYGLRVPCALQPHWRLSREYGIFATPVAFLIDADGVVAGEVAKGPDEIVALARDALALAGRS